MTAQQLLSVIEQRRVSALHTPHDCFSFVRRVEFEYGGSRCRGKSADDRRRGVRRFLLQHATHARWSEAGRGLGGALDRSAVDQGLQERGKRRHRETHADHEAQSNDQCGREWYDRTVEQPPSVPTQSRSTTKIHGVDGEQISAARVVADGGGSKLTNLRQIEGAALVHEDRSRNALQPPSVRFRNELVRLTSSVLALFEPAISLAAAVVTLAASCSRNFLCAGRGSAHISLRGSVAPVFGPYPNDRRTVAESGIERRLQRSLELLRIVAGGAGIAKGDSTIVQNRDVRRLQLRNACSYKCANAIDRFSRKTCAVAQTKTYACTCIA